MEEDSTAAADTARIASMLDSLDEKVGCVCVCVLEFI